MDICFFHMLVDRAQSLTKCRSELAGRDDLDAGFLQQSAFQRIDISGSNQADPLVRNRLEVGHRSGELSPAPAGQNGDRGTVQESAGGRLGSIEISVRIEPNDPR